MTRPIPRRLLPHINMVKLELSLGAGANGRVYGPEITIHRSLIVDGVALVKGKYDPQSHATGTFYTETGSLDEAMAEETRVTLWQGTRYERVVYVDSYTRYFDPQIGDILEVRIR